MSWLGGPTLTVAGITLRPLGFDDVPELANLVGNPEAFKWSPGIPLTVADAEAYVEAANGDDTRQAFAVVDAGGALVGSTSYYEIEERYLSAAIGYTFYTESAQGTVINPASKYLLLHHAFDTCGAVRMAWHTHENNERSRAAIAKLGASFEGLIRKHRRFGDGWRTTAQYSMIDDDWPAARDRLLTRIG